MKLLPEQFRGHGAEEFRICIKSKLGLLYLYEFQQNKINRPSGNTRLGNTPRRDAVLQAAELAAAQENDARGSSNRGLKNNLERPGAVP
jgi:hypothetical protein